MFLRSLGLLVLLILTPSVATAQPPEPTFGLVTPGWVDPPLAFPLDYFWHASNFPESGTTFYTSAAPIAGSTYWERFNPNSDRYQAWFSTYVIQDFSFGSEWNQPCLGVQNIQKSIQRLIDLSLIDQKTWLAAYGDPNPRADIVPGSIAVAPLHNNEFLLLYTLRTHSDVGGTIPAFPWYPPYATEAACVSPYQDILVNAVFRFTYDAPSHCLLVTFFSGNEWTTNDGVLHATPAYVFHEQVQMLRHVTFH